MEGAFHTELNETDWCECFTKNVAMSLCPVRFARSSILVRKIEGLRSRQKCLCNVHSRSVVVRRNSLNFVPKH